MINRLVFDTADATTIAQSSNVGAYLRSADGTLLTHTDVDGKMALDVRVAEGINVEVDLDAADDSVASWTNDGAGNAIGSTGGALHISDAGDSLTVDATDFDIRDLDSATDSVTAIQGTSPWVVSATDLDIRDLAFATDKVDVSGSVIALDAGTLAALESITVQNGAGAAAVNIQDGGNSITVDGSVTVNDAALANTQIQQDAATVSTTAALFSSPLASRKYAMIYNNGSKAVYIGASGVTTANGFPVFPGSMLEARVGASVAVHAVAESGSQNVRLLQFS